MNPLQLSFARTKEKQFERNRTEIWAKQSMT
jgi:hypothetical protein